MSLELKPFSLQQYQNLVEESTILEQDRRGVKVLRTPQGPLVKLFRLKSIWSSALFKPYARRFAENAGKLTRLGFETIAVRELFYCRAVKRYLLCYDPVPGSTLRDALAGCCDVVENPDSAPQLDRFAEFLAELHYKGVLFRSVHFGNIIVMDAEKGFGLIDIADMSFSARPLSISARLRNFRHMTRYQEDILSLQQSGMERFIDAYLHASGLSVAAQNAFLKKLPKAVTAFADC
ncbi:MAG: hypothetical protein OET90_07110 [Desulfuromonadales bacterium]|nr:hypothetical protein [Desulfuromonadales bacterium]